MRHHVYLSTRSLDRIVRDSKREAPREACLLIFEHVDGRPLMTVSVRNVAEEDDQYSIDPHEQLRAMMLMGSKWKLVGCCHSHVHVDATPSALDVSLMIPDQLYFIHSVRDEVIRGWEMVGDDVREVVVHVAR